YLPKEWTQDKARLQKAGVPKAHRGYRTRHQLALDMLEKNGPVLPHAWIAGDDEMGRPYWFRRRLAGLGERYLLAVPSNTLMRDLETAARVVSRTHRRQQGHEEMLVVMRYRDRDNQQVVKVDYYLSNAAPETPLWQFARVAKAEHRIEDCIQRSKSEAGLADYEVRNWTGWQHHQTLSLLATWFLVQETERGKKMDAS